ncbi:uncharacterized protein LOC142231157 [Haematobia irritans]|uniref:uncharacterized protein LOC142231157 n=1 Tax=Haematobia irritans TaxID=7368 RepID=UPI003F50B8D1
MTKFDELKSIICGSGLHVVVLSETWLKPIVSTRSLRIDGFEFYRNDRVGSRGGGVGIYVSSALRHKIIFKSSILGKCESLFLELFSGSSRVLCGVVYLPPPGDMLSFEEVHRNLFFNYSRIIALGDFNCNMFNTNCRDSVRSACHRLSMSVSHNSKPTHYDVVHGTTSLIDFMLVTPNLEKVVSDQVQCPAISHHALIFASFEFDLDHSEVITYVEFYDYRNIDVVGMQNYLNSIDSSPIFDSTDVNAKCSLVSSLITDLCAFVPIVRRTIDFRCDSWLNSQKVIFYRSLRDLSYSAFQADRTSAKWRIFCRYRNKAKSVMRKEKRKYYFRRFNGLSTDGLWKVLRGAGCVGGDGFSFDGDLDEVNNFFVNCAPTDYVETFDFNSFSFPEDGFSFNCVGVEDVSAAIRKIKSRSVGVDNISIQLLNCVFPYISDVILNLFNSILTTSVFPSGWKMARVVPIPKFKVVNGPDDLRPISILPVLSKICEHLIKDQLIFKFGNKFLSSQHGFRKGHSTTSLLLHLTDSIRGNINSANTCALVSIDLTKAFNSICFLTLIKKLCLRYHFSITACRFILSYLSGRIQFVDLNKRTSCILPLNSGVPQGSILGPLLFLLYMDDLGEYLSGCACSLFIYADDVFLLFNSRRGFSDVLESNINYCLGRVAQWSSDNSFVVNPQKTKALLFGGDSDAIDVRLGMDRIEFVSQIKCLGVLIDQHLSFVPHIDISTLDSIQTCTCVIVACYKIRSGDFFGSDCCPFSAIEIRDEYYCQCANLLFLYKVIRSGVPSTLCDYFRFSRSTRNPQIILLTKYTLLIEQARFAYISLKYFWDFWEILGEYYVGSVQKRVGSTKKIHSGCFLISVYI